MRLTQNTAPRSESSPNQAFFVCPLNFKEMNGSQSFVYLSTCGCVFSQAGLRAVTSSFKAELKKDSPQDETNWKEIYVCPQCATKYDRADNVIMLNPGPEEESELFVRMLASRATESKPKSKKRKAGVDTAHAEDASKKKRILLLPSTNSNMTTASRAVASSLAEEEVKRKASMSEAVKSLYGPKDGVKKKETFMTMGTFTRVSSFENLQYDHCLMTRILFCCTLCQYA